MSVSEQERHDLHTKLSSVLGTKEAATMMALTPPVGWADVATKNDLDHLAERMDSRFDSLEHRAEARVEALERRLIGRHAESQRQLLLAMMGTMLAMVIAVSGLAFAAAGLT